MAAQAHGAGAPINHMVPFDGMIEPPSAEVRVASTDKYLTEVDRRTNETYFKHVFQIKMSDYNEKGLFRHKLTAMGMNYLVFEKKD
jgi:hypothetical protein